MYPDKHIQSTGSFQTVPIYDCMAVVHAGQTREGKPHVRQGAGGWAARSAAESAKESELPDSLPMCMCSVSFHPFCSVAEVLAF